MSKFSTTLLLPFFIICTLLLASCTTNVSELPKEIRSFSNADQRLWAVLTAFEGEAAKRGYFIDLEESGIKATIEKLNNSQAVGLCTYNVNQPNTIKIDASYWNRANDSRREKIVFHELGHCLLGRTHNDDADTKGICLSIMRSGTGGCLDFYDNDHRANYLDELFKIQ